VILPGFTGWRWRPRTVPVGSFRPADGNYLPEHRLVATPDEQQVDITTGALIQKKVTGCLNFEVGGPGGSARNGVGSILIAELPEVFRTPGVRTVQFTVGPGNVPAPGLSMKVAVVQESYDEAYFRKDEDRIVMVREMDNRYVGEHLLNKREWLILPF
jgi:hypothetical protein